MDSRLIGAASDRAFETAQGDASQRNRCCARVAASMFHGTRETSPIAALENAARTWNGGSSGVFPLIISLQGENHMLAKFITAGLVGTALLATVASAQTPTTTTDRANMAPAAASDSSFQGDWRASKVVGLSVYNENNESVGSINDLLTDKNGNIKAVVIGVGGFLGVGEHLVAIPFEKIKFVNEPVAYTGVAGAPNAPGSRPASSTTTGAATTNAVPASKPNPWYPDHAVFNATKDELKAMPEFKYSS
jgi:sporulation protein YlmC with PRC-barrel domain